MSVVGMEYVSVGAIANTYLDTYSLLYNLNEERKSDCGEFITSVLGDLDKLPFRGDSKEIISNIPMYENFIDRTNSGYGKLQLDLPSKTIKNLSIDALRVELKNFETSVNSGRLLDFDLKGKVSSVVSQFVNSVCRHYKK